MDMALLIAKSGLDAHHKTIEVISNNLANAETTGFKKNRPEFQDLPYQVITQTGAAVTQDTNNPGGLVIGTGVKMSANKKIYSQGTPIQTDNPLNVNINGRGFLKVQLPNGNYAYTRDGGLSINEQGQITTSNGYVIQPPMTIPQGSGPLNITKDGMVSVQSSDGTVTQLGQLSLSDFINPDGLDPQGENLFYSTVASGTPVDGTPTQNGLGQIVQNQLEGSNVNVVEEMVNLIEAQRSFEVTSKAVAAVDGMLQTLSRET